MMSRIQCFSNLGECLLNNDILSLPLIPDSRCQFDNEKYLYLDRFTIVILVFIKAGVNVGSIHSDGALGHISALYLFTVH